MSGPRVVLVGRRNVGKSTLANRLVGGREAITHDLPGVTRDRLELEVSWGGRRFWVVDTAGYEPRASGVDAEAIAQTDRALAEADAVVLVVDAHAGITEDDARVARRLRRARVPVLLVANKVDGPNQEPDAAVFHRLGLGAPLAVSALHGRGVGELLDRLADVVPERVEADERPEPEPRFAIVGRPNVGKSSLFNRLVGDERAVVSASAGTTRDAVDTVVRWPGHGPARIVDTAGLRRGTRVRGVEYYGVLRSVEAIRRAGVVLLVLDATDGFTTEDRKIARRILDEGRALLLAANKWDLVREPAAAFEELAAQARAFADAEVVRTSARTGRGVARIPPVLFELHARWRRRVPTSSVNEELHAAQRERPPARGVGTLRYATQVRAGPPTFVVFGAAREPDPGYQRYLEHRLRRAFGFGGVPIELRFRIRRERRSRGR